MKRQTLWVLSLILLVACGGSDSEQEPAAQSERVEVVYEIDEESGLPLNPPMNALPEGEFMVEGEITAVTLIPQDKPLFKIATESGTTYQVNAQPVPDIYVEDGSQLAPYEIQSGLRARATLRPGERGGLAGDFAFDSDDLVLLLDEE